MGKLNCWNWKNCGRYPGGSKAKDLGICTASVHDEVDGFMNGRNAGRACMYIFGTFCGVNKSILLFRLLLDFNIAC